MYYSNLNLIHSGEKNGFISVDAVNANTLVFFIDLPKNAAVDHVRIKGDFEVDNFDIHRDRLLEDIECPVCVTYRRELAYEAFNPNRMQRCAATVRFPEGIPSDLLTKVLSGYISDFDVYYHLEAITEV